MALKVKVFFIDEKFGAKATLNIILYGMIYENLSAGLTLRNSDRTTA